MQKHRSKGRKLVITLDELEQLAQETPNCMYCGHELAWVPHGDRKTHSDSPTLDRYHNENTLSKQSVRIVCYRCNAGKGDDTYEKYVKRCKDVIKRYEDPIISSRIQSIQRI
jgi:uncharacterized protein (DUF983 family)